MIGRRCPAPAATLKCSNLKPKKDTRMPKSLYPVTLACCLVACFMIATPIDADTIDGIASWQSVQQHGDVPPPIWEAGASFGRKADSNVVYRFGGQVGQFPDDPVLNDFYALDLETFTWTHLASTDTPAPRADVLMIPGPCGQCVSVVGGRGRFRTGSDHMFPEMWTYQVQSGKWKEVGPQHLGDPFALRRSSAPVIAVQDPAPPHKPTFYAFGGVGNTLPSFPTTTTGLRNDMAVYSKQSGWSSLATFGDHPAPRGWASAEYDPIHHAILVFGGYRLGPDQGPDTPPYELFGPTNYENDLWSLDLETLIWTKIEPTGSVPNPRDNARGFFDASRGGWVLFGGQEFDGPVNDLWFYSVVENQWSEVALSPGSPIPLARVGAVHFLRETATSYELFIHSGATSDGGASLFLNDLWKLVWPKRLGPESATFRAIDSLTPYRIRLSAEDSGHPRTDREIIELGGQGDLGVVGHHVQPEQRVLPEIQGNGAAGR